MNMSRLEISLLGANQIRLNAQTITNVGGDKPLALLFYLVMENNRPHRREFLASMFWPDQSADKALHNLRQALTSLRKAIRDDEAVIPCLSIQRDTIQVNPDAEYWLDVEQFSKSADEALGHNHALHPNRIRISKLEKAVALYKGNFLDQFFLSDSSVFEEWAIITRESLSRRVLQCMQILIEIYCRRDDYPQASRMAENLVKIAPWDEEHYRILMRLLAQDCRWSEAQSVYQTCVRYLSSSLDCQPSRETILLQEKIASYVREKKDFPKPPRPPQNLPAITTKFIGRENEKGEITDLLTDPDCRLLTIHGMGGVGKTRLAIETARNQTGLYPDGVWFISLEALETTDHLVAALLAMFHLSLPPGTDPKSVLNDYLQNKNMMLILDSYEHVGADPGLILGILANAPQVILLVTSRQTLSIQQEWVYPLKGLSVSQDTSNDESGAVQLFVQRALQLGYPIILDEPTRQVIKEICSLVDGLPLGIELASTSLSGSTCQQVLEDIRQTFGTLQTTHHDVHERHRSLQAAFEYSWKNLPSQLKSVVSNLSVFRGGFTALAAKEIFHVGTVDLQALASHSLLQQTSQGRFAMHDVIRQFSEEKLISEPAALELVYVNYASWYTRLMENAAPKLLSMLEKETIEDLKRELPNLLNSIKILQNKKAETELIRSADCIYHFYQILGQFNEGIMLCKGILDSIDNRSEKFFVTFQNRLAGLQMYGRFDQDAIDNLQGCYETAVKLDDHFETGFNLAMQSSYYHRKGDQAAAIDKATQAIKEFDSCGSDWGQSLVQYLLGKIYHLKGQIKDSKDWYNRSLKTAQSINHPHSQLRVLNAMGDLACQLDELDEGLDLFTKCLELSRSLDDRYNQAIQINNLGTIYHLKGNFEEAERSYLLSLELCRDIGDRAGEATALANLGEISLVQNDLSSARDRFVKGLTISQAIDDDYNIIICNTNLGETFYKTGDLDRSRDYLLKALKLTIENEDRTLLSKALVIYAMLAAKQKNDDLANDLANWIKDQEFSAPETIMRAKEVLKSIKPTSLPREITVDDLSNLLENF
jgi:predicted ATPase/DNA-binding SARP family transcriptional activator/Tfp pilus assembly protein PilF